MLHEETGLYAPVAQAEFLDQHGAGRKLQEPHVVASSVGYHLTIRQREPSSFCGATRPEGHVEFIRKHAVGHHPWSIRYYAASLAEQLGEGGCRGVRLWRQPIQPPVKEVSHNHFTSLVLSPRSDLVGCLG